MTERDFSVPPEWAELADRLDVVSAAVRTYLETPEAAWPSSTSARERANSSVYAALPWSHPSTHVALMPLGFLGTSQDHLTGLAAVMRTPLTVMAQMTVLRTQLVANARAAWLLEPSIDQRERTRRAINFDLESKTEQMLMFAGSSDADTKQEFDRLDQRRRDITKAAKALGWSANTPEGRAYPKLWWVGDKPVSEMHLVNRVIDDVAAPTKQGLMLYRYLSATSHAQPHGMASFIKREHTTRYDDGSAMAAIGVSGDLIMTLSLMAVGSLTMAMSYAIRYYGWSPRLWVDDALQLVNELRAGLRVPTPLIGIPLLS